MLDDPEWFHIIALFSFIDVTFLYVFFSEFYLQSLKTWERMIKSPENPHIHGNLFIRFFYYKYNQRNWIDDTCKVEVKNVNGN